MKCFDIKKNGFFIIFVVLFFVFFPLKGNFAKAYVCISTEENANCRDLQANNFAEANGQCSATEILVRGACYNPDGRATDYGCVTTEQALCSDFQAVNQAQANQNCVVPNLNAVVISRKCPISPEPIESVPNIPNNGITSSEFGCIKPDGVCININDKDGVIAAKKCLDTYGKKARPQPSSCLPDREYACYFSDTGACTVVKANTPEFAGSACTALCKSENKAKCYVNLDFNEKCEAERPGPLAGTSIEDLQKKAAKQLNPGNISEPKKLISRAINLMTAFIGSIALLLYVVAGFLWMTAGGASEQVDKAKKILVWTTLGVLVMLFSYILTNTFFELIPK